MELPKDLASSMCRSNCTWRLRTLAYRLMELGELEGEGLSVEEATRYSGQMGAADCCMCFGEYTRNHVWLCLCDVFCRNSSTSVSGPNVAVRLLNLILKAGLAS